MSTLGLTLGKFAPLHKGHQLMLVIPSAYFINAAYGWMLWTKGARKNEVAT